MNFVEETWFIDRVRHIQIMICHGFEKEKILELEYSEKEYDIAMEQLGAIIRTLYDNDRVQDVKDLLQNSNFGKIEQLAKELDIKLDIERKNYDLSRIRCIQAITLNKGYKKEKVLELNFTEDEYNVALRQLSRIIARLVFSGRTSEAEELICKYDTIGKIDQLAKELGIGLSAEGFDD